MRRAVLGWIERRGGDQEEHTVAAADPAIPREKGGRDGRRDHDGNVLGERVAAHRNRAHEGGQAQDQAEIGDIGWPMPSRRAMFALPATSHSAP